MPETREEKGKSVLNTRAGPVIVFVSSIVMMAAVFLQWAYIQVNVGTEVHPARNLTGWGLFAPRVLFYLLIIPVVISILMIIGLGTKRKSLEVNLLSFFTGACFMVFATLIGFEVFATVASEKLKVVKFDIKSGVWLMIAFFIIYVIGLVITAGESRPKE